MVGKVSERVLQREGLERTDNAMRLTSWPDVAAINQKNYYTDFMKRDDQVLALRLQSEAQRDRLVQNAKDRDRALARNGSFEVPLSVPELPTYEGAPPATDGLDASKIIVIHPGSQNLRIGFSSDALPRTIPSVLATPFPQTESESVAPLPRRHPDPEPWKTENGKPPEVRTMEQLYGEEWARKYQRHCNDLKVDMRVNKRKVLPNSKELVVKGNYAVEAEKIPLHNDPMQIEWTDVNSLDDPTSAASCFIGQAALRVPDRSDPKFKLWWPIQHGWLNEDDYHTAEHLLDDLETLLDRAIRLELGLTRSSTWKNYSCVFVIPDLYDKRYVEELLKSSMTWFEFNRVCFIQESMAASYGAGYTQACVVDVGAQKTSVACVEDGLVMEDSRINMKFGGHDVTETFIRMLLFDCFPYRDINLRRRYDFLLAEELKIKHCTMQQADISVQTYQFHLRVPDQPTVKYTFKTYDEVILAPMGFFDPSMFDHSVKLRGRRKLIDRSYNAYDVDMPDDPLSRAQEGVLSLAQPAILPHAPASYPAVSSESLATPIKERPQPFFLGRGDNTPLGSTAASPAPEGNSTPVPPTFHFGGNGTVTGAASPLPPGAQIAVSPAPPPGIFVESRTAKMAAMERDAILPIAPLDLAILCSIQNAARGDEKKLRDYLGSIMVVGGGCKTPAFAQTLEDRLKVQRPDLSDRILVSRSARDMDEQVVAWKGASVFAKLSVNDSWITPYEYERLGVRVLHHKVLWAWTST